MKKLLIMSMALLLGVTSGFSQVKTRTVKTVKSNSAAVEDVKKKTADAVAAVKKEAAEALKNSKGTTNGRVTKPSKKGTQSRETLVLLTDDYKPSNSNGRVTRPSKTGTQSKETLILLTDDFKKGNSNGRVTRPSSNAGTKGKEGVNDLILLDGDNDPRDTKGKVGTKGRIGDDGGVQDMWDDSRMKPTNGKTNVVNRRGGTRRR